MYAHFFRKRDMLMIMKKAVGAIAAASFALFNSTAYASWSITDIGTLGGSISQAFGINDSGQVVGSSTTSEGNSHAFVYSNGQIADIGTLGGASSTAYSINNSGQIVGSSLTAPGTNGAIFGTAFLYSGGQMTDLGVLGGNASIAFSINNLGQVVGQSTVGPGNQFVPAPNSGAFLYSGGQMIALTPSTLPSAAFDINNNGEIIGTSNVPGTIPPRPNATIFANGGATPLGTLAGPPVNSDFPFASSRANAVNDQGQIVGSSSIRSGDPSATHAFLYDNGKMIDVGTPGLPSGISNPNSTAVDINNAGQIVGVSSGFLPSGASVAEAFLYDHGSVTNLSALSEVLSAGWKIDAVSAINNLGQIVGYGTINGQQHGFILSSLAAPELDGSNGMLALALLGGMLSLIKRQRTAV
jgi:probable HAF family extracellular repeat protein